MRDPSLEIAAILVLLVDLLYPLHVLLVYEVIDLRVVVRTDVVRLQQHRVLI